MESWLFFLLIERITMKLSDVSLSLSGFEVLSNNVWPCSHLQLYAERIAGESSQTLNCFRYS